MAHGEVESPSQLESFNASDTADSSLSSSLGLDVSCEMEVDESSLDIDFGVLHESCENSSSSQSDSQLSMPSSPDNNIELRSRNVPRNISSESPDGSSIAGSPFRSARIQRLPINANTRGLPTNNSTPSTHASRTNRDSLLQFKKLGAIVESAKSIYQFGIVIFVCVMLVFMILSRSELPTEGLILSHLESLHALFPSQFQSSWIELSQALLPCHNDPMCTLKQPIVIAFIHSKHSSKEAICLAQETSRILNNAAPSGVKVKEAELLQYHSDLPPIDSSPRRLLIFSGLPETDPANLNILRGMAESYIDKPVQGNFNRIFFTIQVPFSEKFYCKKFKEGGDLDERALRKDLETELRELLRLSWIKVRVKEYEVEALMTRFLASLIFVCPEPKLECTL